MKNYDFAIIDDNNRKIYIVFSTNYISPLKMINEIQETICEHAKISADIYFDFLLCNRNEKERFAKISCTNGSLDLENFSYVSVDKKSPLRKISAHYYRENYDSLDWTYAGKNKMKLIINGVIL